MNNPGIHEHLRTQSGFSQLQVAEYLGISLSDYLRYTKDVNIFRFLFLNPLWLFIMSRNMISSLVQHSHRLSPDLRYRKRN